MCSLAMYKNQFEMEKTDTKSIVYRTVASGNRTVTTVFGWTAKHYSHRMEKWGKKVSLTIVLEMKKMLRSISNFISSFYFTAYSTCYFQMKRRTEQKKCLAPKAIMRCLLYSLAIASKLLKPVTFDVSRFFRRFCAFGVNVVKYVTSLN